MSGREIYSRTLSIDFYDNDGQISSQHYDFLISEEEFDQIFGRVRNRGVYSQVRQQHRHGY